MENKGLFGGLFSNENLQRVVEEQRLAKVSDTPQAKEEHVSTPVMQDEVDASAEITKEDLANLNPQKPKEEQREAVVDAIPDTPQEEAAIEEEITTSNEAWDLSREDWVNQQLAEHADYEYALEEDNEELANEIINDLQTQWYAKLVERNEVGVISNAALDDLVARVGHSAVTPFINNVGGENYVSKAFRENDKGSVEYERDPVKAMELLINEGADNLKEYEMFAAPEHTESSDHYYISTGEKQQRYTLYMKEAGGSRGSFISNLTESAEYALRTALEHAKGRTVYFDPNFQLGVIQRNQQQEAQGPKAEETVEDMHSIQLTHGKYKGMTIAEVLEQDPEYLDWITQNTDFFSKKRNAIISEAVQEKLKAAGKLEFDPTIQLSWGKYSGYEVGRIFEIDPSYSRWLKSTNQDGALGITIDRLFEQAQEEAQRKIDSMPAEDAINLLKARRIEFQHLHRVPVKDSDNQYDTFSIKGFPNQIGSSYVKNSLSAMLNTDLDYDRDAKHYRFSLTATNGETTEEAVLNALKLSALTIQELEQTRDSKIETILEDARDAAKEQEAVNPSDKVSDFVKQELRKGLEHGMTESVINDQIEDVGKLLIAYEQDKGGFVLGNEAGTGKSFVLAAFIHELKHQYGVDNLTYLTMNQDLVAQFKADTTAFDTDHANFITYSKLRELTTDEIPKRGGVILADESHNLANITSKQGEAGQALMRNAKFTVAASATPFNDPAHAYYLDVTGMFKDSFKSLVISFGAVCNTFGYTDSYQWRGGVSGGKAFREWLELNGLITQRQMQLPAHQIQSEFLPVDIGKDYIDLYNRVVAAYDTAIENNDDAYSLAVKDDILRHRENTLKRILEASKVPAAVDLAFMEIADGRYPVIFTESRSERHLGQFRKMGEDSSAELYTYPQMQAMMAEWKAEQSMASPFTASFGSNPPPFADFIMEIAAAYHQHGVDEILPSTVSQIKQLMGNELVAEYTGGVSAKKAQDELQAWREGEKQVLVVTGAKGGTGLSLHDTKGDHPTTQIVLVMYWSARLNEQVAGRTARYGLKGEAKQLWLVANPDAIPTEERLCNRLALRLQDMGAAVKGIDHKSVAQIDEAISGDAKPVSLEFTPEAKLTSGAITVEQYIADNNKQDWYEENAQDILEIAKKRAGELSGYNKLANTTLEAMMGMASLNKNGVLTDKGAEALVAFRDAMVRRINPITANPKLPKTIINRFEKRFDEAIATDNYERLNKLFTAQLVIKGVAGEPLIDFDPEHHAAMNAEFEEEIKKLSQEKEAERKAEQEQAALADETDAVIEGTQEDEIADEPQADDASLDDEANPVDEANLADEANLGAEEQPIYYYGIDASVGVSEKPSTQSAVIWASQSEELATYHTASLGADNEQLMATIDTRNPIDFGFPRLSVDVKLGDVLERIHTRYMESLETADNVDMEFAKITADLISSQVESVQGNNELKPVWEWVQEEPLVEQLVAAAGFDSIKARIIEGTDIAEVVAVLSKEQINPLNLPKPITQTVVERLVDTSELENLRQTHPKLHEEVYTQAERILKQDKDTLAATRGIAVGLVFSGYSDDTPNGKEIDGIKLAQALAASQNRGVVPPAAYTTAASMFLEFMATSGNSNAKIQHELSESLSGLRSLADWTPPAEVVNEPIEDEAIKNDLDDADRAKQEIDNEQEDSVQASLFDQSPQASLFDDADTLGGAQSGQKQTPDAKIDDGRIADTGHIPYAAKHRYQAYIDSLAMDDEKLAHIAKLTPAKIFPLPNYNSLVSDSILTEEGALALSILRDNLLDMRKPRGGQALKDYGTTTSLLMASISMALNHEDSLGIGSEVLVDTVNTVGSTRLKLALLNKLREETKDDYDLRQLISVGNNFTYTSYGNQYSDSGFENRAQVAQKKGWNSLLERRFEYTEISDIPSRVFEAYVSKGKEYLERDAEKAKNRTNNRGKPVEIYLLNNRLGKYFAGFKAGGRHTVIEEIKMPAELPEGVSARQWRNDWIKENESRLQEVVEKMKDYHFRRDDNSPRVGEDYRAGRDITPKELEDTFGLRALQFGNSTLASQREAQARVNEAYDALMDLSKITDLPPKAIGLNGSLALAFGARGRGGRRAAMAHYEPDLAVVNLTRRSGAGSLAHEWFHAFDNFLKKQAAAGEAPTPDDLKSLSGIASKPYISASYKADGAREEVFAAFKKSLDDLSGSVFLERAENLDNFQGRDGDKAYWSSNVELTARMFEAYCVLNMEKKGEENAYLANIIFPEDDNPNNPSAIPSKAEMEEKGFYQNMADIFDEVKLAETEYGYALFKQVEDEAADFDEPEQDAVQSVEEYVAKYGATATTGENGLPIKFYQSFDNDNGFMFTDSLEVAEANASSFFNEKAVYIGSDLLDLRKPLDEADALVLNTHASNVLTIDDRATLESAKFKYVFVDPSTEPDPMIGMALHDEINTMYEDLESQWEMAGRHPEGEPKIYQKDGNIELHYTDYARELNITSLQDILLIHQKNPKLFNQVLNVEGVIFEDEGATWVSLDSLASNKEIVPADNLPLSLNPTDDNELDADADEELEVGGFGNDEAKAEVEQDEPEINEANKERAQKYIQEKYEFNVRPVAHYMNTFEAGNDLMSLPHINEPMPINDIVEAMGFDFQKITDDSDVSRYIALKGDSELRKLPTASGDIYRLSIPNSDDELFIHLNRNTLHCDLQDLKKQPPAVRNEVYQSLAAFSYMTNRSFYSDISPIDADVALERNDQMLSSGLRFGSFRHIVVNQEQKESKHIAPLPWGGSPIDNLGKLLHSQYETAERYAPDIANVQYNPDLMRFEAASGVELENVDNANAMADYLNQDDTMPVGQMVSGMLDTTTTVASFATSRNFLRRAAMSRTMFNRRPRPRHDWATSIAATAAALNSVKRNTDNLQTAFHRLHYGAFNTRPTFGMVSDWVNVVERKTGIQITVVRSASELPEELQKGINQNVRGLYSPVSGESYVIADRMNSKQDTIKVALHEALGHGGVINFLKLNHNTGGSEFANTLESIYKDIGETEIKSVIGPLYKFDFKDPKERQMAVLEYIAHLAETGEKPELVHEATSKKKDMLDETLGDMNWTKNDILSLIDASRLHAVLTNTKEIDEKYGLPEITNKHVLDMAAQEIVKKRFERLDGLLSAKSDVQIPESDIEALANMQPLYRLQDDYAVELSAETGKAGHLYTLNQQAYLDMDFSDTSEFENAINHEAELTPQRTLELTSPMDKQNPAVLNALENAGLYDSEKVKLAEDYSNLVDNALIAADRDLLDQALELPIDPATAKDLELSMASGEQYINYLVRNVGNGTIDTSSLDADLSNERKVMALLHKAGIDAALYNHPLEIDDIRVIVTDPAQAENLTYLAMPMLETSHHDFISTVRGTKQELSSQITAPQPLEVGGFGVTQRELDRAQDLANDLKLRTANSVIEKNITKLQHQFYSEVGLPNGTELAIQSIPVEKLNDLAKGGVVNIDANKPKTKADEVILVAEVGKKIPMPVYPRTTKEEMEFLDKVKHVATVFGEPLTLSRVSMELSEQGNPDALKHFFRNSDALKALFINEHLNFPVAPEQNENRLIDHDKTASLIRTYMTGYEAEFEYWLQKEVGSFYEQPVLEVGDKSYPYTVENVANYLSNKPLVADTQGISGLDGYEQKLNDILKNSVYTGANSALTDTPDVCSATAALVRLAASNDPSVEQAERILKSEQLAYDSLQDLRAAAEHLTSAVADLAGSYIRHAPMENNDRKLKLSDFSYAIANDSLSYKEGMSLAANGVTTLFANNDLELQTAINTAVTGVKQERASHATYEEVVGRAALSQTYATASLNQAVDAQDTPLNLDDESILLQRSYLDLSDKVTLQASRINSSADLAKATAFLASNTIERFMAVATDARGKPLAIVHDSTGTIGSANVDPTRLMYELARVPAANKLWVSHNHPAGIPHLSESDKHLYEKIAGMTKGIGITTEAIIAVAEKGGRIAFTSSDESFSDDLKPNPINESTAVPVIKREKLTTPTNMTTITSPETAVEAAVKLEIPFPSVMLLNNQNSVVGYVPIDEKVSGLLVNNPDEPKNEGAHHLLRAASEVNAVRAIILSDSTSQQPAALSAPPVDVNIARALETFGVDVLDRIIKEDDGEITMTSRHQPHAIAGVGFREQPFYSLASKENTNTTAQEVKEWIKPITDYDFNSKVVVVQTKYDIPYNVIKENMTDDELIKGNFNGLYSTKDKVAYIVANKIKDKEDALKTAFHESIGHGAVLDFFNKNKKEGGQAIAEQLDTIYKLAGQDIIKNTTESYRFNHEDSNDRRTAVLEFIAIASENSHRIATLNKPLAENIKQAASNVMGMIRELVRKVHPELKWNDTDTKYLVSKAANHSHFAATGERLSLYNPLNMNSKPNNAIEFIDSKPKQSITQAAAQMASHFVIDAPMLAIKSLAKGFNSFQANDQDQLAQAEMLIKNQKAKLDDAVTYTMYQQANDTGYTVVNHFDKKVTIYPTEQEAKQAIEQEYKPLYNAQQQESNQPNPYKVEFYTNLYNDLQPDEIQKIAMTTPEVYEYNDVEYQKLTVAHTWLAQKTLEQPQSYWPQMFDHTFAGTQMPIGSDKVTIQELDNDHLVMRLGEGAQAVEAELKLNTNGYMQMDMHGSRDMDIRGRLLSKVLDFASTNDFTLQTKAGGLRNDDMQTLMEQSALSIAKTGKAGHVQVYPQFFAGLLDTQNHKEIYDYTNRALDTLKFQTNMPQDSFSMLLDLDDVYADIKAADEKAQILLASITSMDERIEQEFGIESDAVEITKKQDSESTLELEPEIIKVRADFGKEVHNTPETQPEMEDDKPEITRKGPSMGM